MKLIVSEADKQAYDRLRRRYLHLLVNSKKRRVRKKALSRWLVYSLVMHVVSMRGVDDGTENADSM